MTSHWFTPDNQSFDDTGVSSSTQPAAAENPNRNGSEASAPISLDWRDLCDKDKPWGEKVIAKLNEY